MNVKAIEKTELNKILGLAAQFTTLEGGRVLLEKMQPTPDVVIAKQRLKDTEEAVALLFQHGVSKVETFPAFEDEINRAEKGSTLS